MQCFSINVREEATEYGFMPTLHLYLLERGEQEEQKARPAVIVVPGGGYTTVCVRENVAIHFHAMEEAFVLLEKSAPICYT